MAFWKDTVVNNNLRIKSLILQGFRSIRTSALELEPFTFLVGQNGSGKSNVVDGFRFVADAMQQPLNAVFDARGGIEAVRYRIPHGGRPANLGIGVEFRVPESQQEGGYAFEVAALPNYGFRVIHERCRLGRPGQKPISFERTEKEGFKCSAPGLTPRLEPQALALPIAGGVEEFAPVARLLSGIRVYSIEPSAVRDLQEPDAGTSLRSDGGNAASVLKMLSRGDKGVLERVSELLSKIVPCTEAVRPKKHGKKLTIEFTQQWAPKKRVSFEAFSMSDGTLRALAILMAVFQEPTPTLIAIEEPEATIHPGALGALMDGLQEAASKTQVLLTTHSPEVLDFKWIRAEDIRVAVWQNGMTRIGRLPAPSVKAIQDHLMGAGELTRSDALAPLGLFAEGDISQGTLFER